MREKNRKIKALLITGIILISVGIIVPWIKLSKKPEARVLLNQVGYLPSMEKIFLLQASNLEEGTGATFGVINDHGTTILQDQELHHECCLWEDEYFSGDFSPLTTPGKYFITIQKNNREIARSNVFSIENDIYDEVLERAIQFYYYQRCGTEVHEIVAGYPGHKACHLDDGYWIDEAGNVHWKNMSGGWHDAGDYGKYTEDRYNTQFAVYSLARAYDILKYTVPAINNSIYDTPAPDAVDEAVWGASFLQKMIVNDLSGKPRILCGIFGRHSGQFDRFGYWEEPSGETDAIPGNEDDRMSGSLFVVSGDTSVANHDYHVSYLNSLDAMMVIAALARTAWVQKDFTYWDGRVESPSNLLGNATALYESHVEMLLDETRSVNNSIGWYRAWTPLLAATELGRWANFTGNETAWNRYAGDTTAILNIIQAGFDTKTSCRWWDPNMAILAYHDRDLVMNGTLTPEFIDLLSQYTQQSLIPAANDTNNPFSHFMSVDWIAELNQTIKYHFAYWGANIGICLPSAIATIAGNVTGNVEAKHYAEKNVLHWIMGRNPLDICQVESLGSRNLPVYHSRYASIPGNPRGAIPGIIPNGIARPNPIDATKWWESPDLPWFDFVAPNPSAPELGNARTNEIYITDNAAFLIGFSTLLQYNQA